MTFSELAIFFDRLEATSSRLALIDILAGLFKQTDNEEIDKVIYLMQGRVAPFYAPIEMGMAEKMVASAIAQAFNEERENVLKENSRKGDLGLVAQELRGKHREHTKELGVGDVFAQLLAIAKTSGDGSVEKKTTAFADLLQDLDSTSVKHLVRISLGKTRLGIGDPTVLDALALAILGDRTQRKLLEKAYNETSDLGLIGKTLCSGGLSAVQKLGVTVGRPIRSELCERLPNPVKVFEKMDKDGQGVHATPKYDGFRVQIHKNGDDVRMYSRNLEDMTHMFPELIEGARKQIKVKTAILDSEALAYQPESEEFLPFQETTKRRRKHNIEEVAKQLPLRAFVFDILYADGKSLIETPLLERMKVLKDILKPDDTLIEAPWKILHQPEELQLMLDDSISKGLEGVVVKRPDSNYVAGGRNFNWIKLKRHSAGALEDTIDTVILGYIYGRGKRTEFGAGALLVGVYDEDKDTFVTVTKIGTGLTDEEWRSIKEKTHGLELEHKPARVEANIIPSVWVKPEIVIEVLADEITRSPNHTAGMVRGEDGKVAEPGYALLFPRLVSFRDKDKRPEDATSVNELIEMYGQQGKK
jgi:DNA ligase-1